MPDPGRILAIDFGLKHIGLAISDASRIVCRPLPKIPFDKQVFSQLAKLSEEFKPTLFLVGYPYHETKSQTNIEEKLNEFISQLENRFPQINLKTIDESFTTVAATALLKEKNKTKIKDRSGRLKQKEILDSVAAQILLQNYLNHGS